MSFTRRRTKRDAASTESRLELERVLGTTTARGTQLATHPALPGTVAYVAGCVTIVCDLATDTQIAHLCADRTLRDPTVTPRRSLGSPHALPLGLPSSGVVPAGPSTSTTGVHPVSGGDPLASYYAGDPTQRSPPWRRQAPRTVSCLAFSTAGTYLAVGESGHQPRVVVWDWRAGLVVAELAGHNFGVLAVAFSPDDRYLVSVGKQHDGFLSVWDWRRMDKVGSNRVTAKVHGLRFAPDGSFFVTVGARHVRFWYLKSQPSNDHQVSDRVEVVEGRSGILGDLRDSTFVDVAVVCPATSPTAGQRRPPSSNESTGSGSSNGCLTPPHVYALTSTGVLCLFSPAQRTLSKWVDTRVGRAHTLTADAHWLVCGGERGHLRAFDPVNLEYVTTFPVATPTSNRRRSPVLWCDPDETGAESASDSFEETGPVDPEIVPPAVRACVLTAGERSGGALLVCVNSDRSIMAWTPPRRPGTDPAALPYHTTYHRDTVWGLLAPRFSVASDTLLTHSADGTVRWWSVRPLPEPTPPGQALLDTLPSPLVDDTPGDDGVRTLALTDDGRLMALGNREGRIAVYDTLHRAALPSFAAHDSEILAVDFVTLTTSERGTERAAPEYLLATGSRDRLIHIFHFYPCVSSSNDDDRYGSDRNNYRWRHLQSLDDHSSSVTCVRFAARGLTIVSCGLDKSVMFRSRAKAVRQPHALASVPPFTLLQNHHGRSTVHDVVLDPRGETLVGVAQDRSLLVFDPVRGKLTATFRPDPADRHRPVPSSSSPVAAALAAADGSLRLGKDVDGTGLATAAVHHRRRSAAFTSSPGGTPTKVGSSTPDYGLVKLALSPDGQLAAVVGSDKTVRLVHLAQRKQLAVAYGPSEPITAVAFLGSRGDRLAVSAADGCILVWRVALLSLECTDGPAVTRLSKHPSRLSLRTDHGIQATLSDGPDGYASLNNQPGPDDGYHSETSSFGSVPSTTDTWPRNPFLAPDPGAPLSDTDLTATVCGMARMALISGPPDAELYPVNAVGTPPRNPPRSLSRGPIARVPPPTPPHLADLRPARRLSTKRVTSRTSRPSPLAHSPDPDQRPLTPPSIFPTCSPGSAIEATDSTIGPAATPPSHSNAIHSTISTQYRQFAQHRSPPYYFAPQVTSDVPTALMDPLESPAERVRATLAALRSARTHLDRAVALLGEVDPVPDSMAMLVQETVRELDLLGRHVLVRPKPLATVPAQVTVSPGSAPGMNTSLGIGCPESQQQLLETYSERLIALVQARLGSTS